MKIIRNLIICLIIGIIILISIIVVLKKNNSVEGDNNTNYTNKNEITGDSGESKFITDDVKEIESFSKLNIINYCIKSFFSNTESNQDEEINKKYALLSKSFIEKNQITSENINKYIKNYNKIINPVILNTKAIINYPIEKYVVYGGLVNTENKIEDYFFLYVNLDLQNNSFSIEPINEEYSEIDNFKFINENKGIELNYYNKYYNNIEGHESAIKYYINKFKTLTFADTQLSYNLIDDEYKEKKFKTIDEYRKYIDLNTNRIKNTVIEKYMVKYNNKYTEFICVDQNGFYFIFRQYTPLNCKVLLDNYTIDSEEFIKKYDEGNSQTKVGMNIEKFISALNCKDYEYIYSKLDEAFKNNNFKTIDDLKKYLDNNSYSTNKITYNTFEEKGNGIYTYQTEISDASNDNSPTKELTIIMKLNENREYVMSFSIN